MGQRRVVGGAERGREQSKQGYKEQEAGGPACVGSLESSRICTGWMGSVARRMEGAAGMCGSRCVEKRNWPPRLAGVVRLRLTVRAEDSFNDVRQRSPGLGSCLGQDLFALACCAAPPNEYLSRVRYGVSKR